MEKRIFAERFESESGLRDWIIAFYEERIAYFIKNMGKETAQGIKITPRVLTTSMKRYIKLSEERDVINRKLLQEN